jgi:hypothetical protein
MKNVYILFNLISLFIISCENKDEFQITDSTVNEQKEQVLSEQKEDVILSENGYLIFKDQESYNKISGLLDKMTDNEFISWEKKMGFQSAQTYLSLVKDQIENLKTLDEFKLLKQKYSNKLVFEEDGSVRLPFYATAWDRVLTVDGVMKIGNKLFKFEKDRELIIKKGDIEDLKDINSLVKDKDRVKEFYPLVEINKSTLKSLQWGTLMGYTIYTGKGIGDSRLTYSLQLISFNYKGYGVTNPPVFYTEAGFQFKLDLLQERKGILGWYNNETMYYFHNVSQHIEYYLPHLISAIWSPHVVVENKSFPDATWGETKYGCTYTFHYYYFVGESNWSFVEPQIYNFNCTFCSRGVGAEQTINYSNI